MASRPRVKPPSAKPRPQPKRDSPVAAGPSRYAIASGVLLIPCFWQSRIQAGDLGSHVYNAWLARLIQAGKAPGLTIVRQTNNVLFDLLLKQLWDWFGAEMAQRIAVSFAVLVLVWGAFALIRRVADRPPWPFLPVVAMVAYGWTYHTGLFNFYISLGLCFWAMSLMWRATPTRLAAAAAILAL